MFFLSSILAFSHDTCGCWSQVARKLVMMEQDLERAEEKAELSEG